MWGELAIQQFPKFLDRHVHDEADIAHAEACDVSDLLVGAVMHEFEANDLLLIGAEIFHKIPDTLVKLTGDGVFTRIWIMTDSKTESVFIAEIKALILAQHIQSAVSADGKKPGFEVVTDLVRISEVELEHGVLHHFTRPFDVAIKDTGRVGDEAALMLIQSTPDEEGGFIWMGLERHGDTVRLLKRTWLKFIRDEGLIDSDLDNDLKHLLLLFPLHTRSMRIFGVKNGHMPRLHVQLGHFRNQLPQCSVFFRCVFPGLL